MLTSRLGRRASAGPCQLLVGVGRRDLPYMGKVSISWYLATALRARKPGSRAHCELNVRPTMAQSFRLERNSSRSRDGGDAQDGRSHATTGLGGGRRLRMICGAALGRAAK